MNVVFSKGAAKVLSRLDAPAKQRIKQGIQGIPNGDIKPLRGAQGIYRLRVGDWRILFSTTNDEIYIRDIGPRGDVYKGV